MSADNDKNRLGRVLALLLIAGAVYGVRSISRGGLGCPMAKLSCCAVGSPAMGHDEHAGADGADGVQPGVPVTDDDEAAIKAKAPVVPAKAE